MSTVVQTNYSPQMRIGLKGLVMDESGFETATRICGDVNGIAFGLAVSQDPSGDDGAILGSGNFLGISCRDVTLNGVSLLPTSNIRAPVDVYDQYRDMAILTRGHIYVVPDTDVAADDPVYYDFVTGTLGNSASGSSGIGNIQFSGQPAVNDTITFNGTVITFVATTPTATHVVIGPTLGDTVDALVTTLNASTDGGIDAATYGAYPSSPGGAGEGSGAYQVNIAFTAPGLAGDSYTLLKSCAAATLSGAVLTGGYGGTDAGGSITFSQQPADNSTITINGTVVTLHDGTGGTVARGASTAAAVDALKTFLNASVDAQIAKCTYDSVGTPTHNQLTITSKTVGVTMNSFTLAASSSPNSYGTLSGTTLAGGIVPSTLVSYAKWKTTALAGSLAVLSLGVQK
jgi:hypothetical protein